MLPIFDGIRDISLLSVAVRMILAVVCGGLIGLEREFKRRPAGFRTHILICLGASMTTLTSQFMYLYLHAYTDMARLGAQVIAGIGFIGAGTIITRRERVKGLTTAAGLWASAIVGLALGAGFYEGGILTTLLIEAAELLFVRIEHKIIENSPEISLYLEYNGREALDSVLAYFKEFNLAVTDLEITRQKSTAKHNACAILSLRLSRGIDQAKLLEVLMGMDGVIMTELL